MVSEVDLLQGGIRDVVQKKKDAKVGHCPVLGGVGSDPVMVSHFFFTFL